MTLYNLYMNIDIYILIYREPFVPPLEFNSSVLHGFMAKTTTGTEFEVSCPSGWGCSVIRCEHKSPSDGHQNWMMGTF
jgi:hypothetical protein